MIKTTFLLPESLHQRLLITSQSEKKSISTVLRELLDDALTKREVRQNKRVYQVLKELDGIGGNEITDASSTIDDLLYGEQGAWRGSE